MGRKSYILRPDMAKPASLPDLLRAHLAKLGAKGGRKGGPARQALMTPAERAELGRKAGKASGAARRRRARLRKKPAR
jgi:hypothetical protein